MSTHNYKTSAPIWGIPLFAVFAVLSALAYAARSVVAHAGAVHLSLAHLCVLQSAISLPILVGMARYQKISLRPKMQGNKANYLLRIITGIGNTLFLLAALKVMPAGLAGTLSSTAPLFTALLAPWLLKEKTTPVILMVASIGFFGLGVAAMPYFKELTPLALGIGLLSGLFGALLQVYLRKIAASGEPGIRGVFMMQTLLFVVSLVCCVFNNEFKFTFAEVGVSAATAVLSVIGQISQSAAYAKGRALPVNALSFLTLPLTIVLSFVCLGESVAAAVLVGMAITMPASFGLVWLEQRHLQHIHNRKAELSEEDIREEHAQAQHSLGALGEPLVETEPSPEELGPRVDKVIPILDQEFDDSDDIRPTGYNYKQGPQVST